MVRHLTVHKNCKSLNLTCTTKFRQDKITRSLLKENWSPLVATNRQKISINTNIQRISEPRRPATVHMDRQATPMPESSDDALGAV